jgi:hypothetical protein
MHVTHLPFVSLENIEEIVNVRLSCKICVVFFGERQYIFLPARPSRVDSVGVPWTAFIGEITQNVAVSFKSRARGSVLAPRTANVTSHLDARRACVALHVNRALRHDVTILSSF